MQRYLPPHLREKLCNGEAAVEQRGLDAAAHSETKVRLVVPSGASFEQSECPLDLEPEGNASTDAATDRKCYTIFFPDKLPEEVLEWFKKAFGECRGARLEFPTDLSKHERAKWHSQAHRKGLPTESQGVGDDRFLSILSPQDVDSEGSGGPVGSVKHAHLSRAQRHRAQQIYDFCQLEGGRFWDYSKGELEDMVAAGTPLPSDLKDMVDRRERGAKVSQLLRQGEPAEALQMLFDDPKLAWQKDEFSGGYPVHIATWKGYHTVVEYLVSLPNVIEQRDGQRETPLAIAMRRGNLEMQQLLLAAGAAPERANYHRPEVIAAAIGKQPPSSGHNSSSDDLHAAAAASAEEEEYVSWNRAERRAYKHGGEGGPSRRRSVDNGRRTSMDNGRRASLDNGRRPSVDAGRRTSMDGKPPAAAGSGRRRSMDVQVHSHCPW